MTPHVESEAEAWRAVHRFVCDVRDNRERRPGRSVLFSGLGDARLRRQIVRWLGREYSEATPGILETLRSALADADWEVRASAMLIAARLRATALRGAVRETLLPSSHQYGLSERDTLLLVAARVVAAESLSSASADDTERVQFVLRRLSDAPHALVRSVLGLPVDHRDDSWLMLHALSTPIELAAPLPDPLPRGVTQRDRRLWLSGIVELCWVSPQRHLLGGGVPIHDPHGAQRAVREYAPSRGFFVTRRPLSAAEATQFGLGTFPAWQQSDATVAARVDASPDAPIVTSHDDALDCCDQLSSRTDAVVELPSADELECAVRGTDGRRYPWGNGLERITGADRSPHGLERFSVPVSQWTSTLDASGTAVAMGGPTAPQCSGRLTGVAASAVRIVVRAGAR